MSKKLTVCLELNIFDEIAFRQATATQAIRGGESQEEADEYLDPEAHDLTSCALMVFDSGIFPGGYEITATTATELLPDAE